MRATTNHLVANLRRFAAPAGISAALAIGAGLYVNHNSVHADMITAAALDDNSVSALSALDQAMETLAARVTPAVVNVAVTSRGHGEDAQTADGGDQDGGAPELPPGFQRFFGPGFGNGQRMPQQQQQQQLQRGVGSGIIVSPDGYIVTNNHVVDGAVGIKVTLHDRRILNAKLVGTDKLTDLAVIKVDARDLPAISWGDSRQLKPGQTVLAFGSPFGYFQFSVTRGIVSAVDRPNPYSDDARKPGGFIQTDAAINPGNSGGALVNAHGELVGINTFIISGSGSFAGAGFAIPSQIAHNVADQLIKNGKVEHGYLGISMNDVTPENARFFNLSEALGAVVSQVSPDSPASRAGLKTGDVISRLDGQKIVNGSALQVAVSGKTPGTKIALGILREGKPMNVDLTVGSFAANKQVAANGGAGNDGSNNGKLGLAVSDLTGDARQQLRIPEDVHGVVIENVRPASPADDAGLQPGDVILEVDRHSTSSAKDFVSEVHGTAAGKDLLLLVWSHGGASYRTVHAASSENNG